ncbi:MAG TPA: AAA family ATPase [Candidatus Angelobacter sp.]|nr:AAA family ATPase [Candidatus Angelobacter sp.]
MAEPHRNALRSMLEGVTGRKGLQVATGPVGTGKTTLLYCLQHILTHEATPAHPLRSAFVVNPTLSQEEFYETLLDELGLPAQASKPASLRELHRFMLKASRENGNVVVIVDEAHLITPALLEEIRLLANLDNYPKSVLQIILCGQPELLAQLRSPELSALKQRIAIFSHLRVLTLAESRAYVAERLHVAGLNGESPFASAAIDELHRLSGGVPRVINLLCDRSLSIGFRQETKRVGTDCVAEAAEELSLAPVRMDGMNSKAVDFSTASTV